ncbi:type 1 glutamine amidotransferase [Nodosilinea sp. AN01ver1]|uniref:type 1 glutamine amidotransferase n=1 Tax=Nodosilinea sp. AN01ver1 TaxID=3423362 RepID=UPI003D318079
MPYALSLTHLYPDYLNLYGDTGNLIVLRRRCQWMGIDCTVNALSMGEAAQAGCTDLYFMGGGQDNDQVAVVNDFHQLKYDAIKADTEVGVVFLGVCGGYQLMGNTFLMGNGEETRGLGIINVNTRAPGTDVKQRCIGNLVAELTPATYADMQTLYAPHRDIPKTLVGFENHSGQTYLGDGVEPLATTIAGFGNNAAAEHEGARYKNVFGSYMHGSLLPKNPHFADYLIGLALRRRYPEDFVTLPVLPDTEEWAAHTYAVQRYG